MCRNTEDANEEEEITKMTEKVLLLQDVKSANLHIFLSPRWNNFFKAGLQKENNVTEKVIKVPIVRRQ